LTLKIGIFLGLLLLNVFNQLDYIFWEKSWQSYFLIFLGYLLSIKFSASLITLFSNEQGVSINSYGVVGNGVS